VIVLHSKMAFTYLAVCIVLCSPLSSASSLLQRVATRHRSFAGYRYSPQDPAARTLVTLDTNRDGRIDPSEVAAFARSQGLDAAAATEEFSSIDTNGDGTLASSELQKVLGTPTTEFASRSGAVTAAAVPQVAAVEEPLPSASQVEPALLPREAPAERTESRPMPDLVAPSRDAQLSSMDFLLQESRSSVVQNAAERVSEELDLKEREELASRRLDRQAAALETQAASIAKATVQDALDAGAAAAHEKANELVAQITTLEDQAEKAEVRAAALRAKSKMEVEEGKQLMKVAATALQESPA